VHLVQSLFSNLLPVVRVICLLPLNLWLSEMHLVPLIDNRVKMLAFSKILLLGFNSHFLYYISLLYLSRLH